MFAGRKVPELRARLVAGAIGGVVGTVVMTAAMRRMHRGLPLDERYPLPPREISERLFPDLSETATQDLSTLAHAWFGAVAGASMTAAGATSAVAGSAGGFLVWLASYLGWVPGAGILRPAGGHPAHRNALMVLVHFVWGAVSVIAANEMLAARSTIFGRGPLKDAPPSLETEAGSRRARGRYSRLCGKKTP